MIYFSGIILMASALAITLTSFSFSPEATPAKPQILYFLFYAAMAFLAYMIGIIVISGKKNKSSKKYLWWILTVSIMCRLYMMWGNPILEDDQYRYVWDGQALIQTGNPYQDSPKGFYLSGKGPTANNSDIVKGIYEHINYPYVKTIYPPTAQILFATAQIATPWSLVGWKMMILLAEILIMIFIIQMLRLEREKPEWVLVYAWSPLILKEYTNSMHLDVFSVLFITIAFYLMMRKQGLLSWIFISLAITTKFYAAILTPLLLLTEYRRSGLGIKLIKGPLIIAGWFVFSYLPFFGTKGKNFEGLLTFAEHWKVNDSMFSLIKWCTHFLVDTPNVGNLLARFIVGILFVGVMVWGCRSIVESRDHELDLYSVSLYMIAAVFFLAPTGNPWYYTWVFPFLAIKRDPALICFSGLVFLYYAAFYFLDPFNKNAYDGVRIIEYGVFALIFILFKWKKNLSYRLSSL